MPTGISNTAPASVDEIVRDGRGSAREVALKKILDAANVLFVQHGFHKTSVRMIADSAGISMGNLYRYIRQKEDLIFLAAAFPAAEVRARLSAVSTQGPVRERLATLFSEYVEVIDHHRAELRMLTREFDNLPRSKNHEIWQMTRWAIEQFETCVSDGVVRNEIEPCDCHIVAVAIHTLAHSWSDRARQLEAYDMPTFLAAQLQNVLRLVPFKTPV